MQNEIVSRAEWLVSREKLLVREKAHTWAGDELEKARQNHPWVKAEKDYQFYSEDGVISLLDLFADKSQLLIYHLMFGATWDVPYEGCATWADAFSGTTDDFGRADANLIAVSRAPYEKLVAEKKRRESDLSHLQLLQPGY